MKPKTLPEPEPEPWPQAKKLAGFTLTELLVVIAIIMILAATAVPALSAFQRGQRLEHASRLVQSYLNDARRRAITKHTRHVVVLYQFQDPEDELYRVRHALAVYSDAIGRHGDKGYFGGGYVGQPLVLPAGVQFMQDRMQFRIWEAQSVQNHAEPLSPDSPYFRVRNPEALTFRPDGTMQPFNDYPGTHPSVGVNIYLPEEGYYEVPDGARADIVLSERTPTGQEIKNEGKSRRVMIDLNPLTGRSQSKVFDVGGGFLTSGSPGGGA